MQQLKQSNCFMAAIVASSLRAATCDLWLTGVYRQHQQQEKQQIKAKQPATAVGKKSGSNLQSPGFLLWQFKCSILLPRFIEQLNSVLTHFFSFCPLSLQVRIVQSAL